MSNESPVLFRTTDVATGLRRHPGSVRRWVRRKELPATKFGRFWLIREDDLRRFARLRPGLPLPGILGVISNLQRRALASAGGQNLDRPSESAEF